MTRYLPKWAPFDQFYHLEKGVVIFIVYEPMGDHDIGQIKVKNELLARAKELFPDGTIMPGELSGPIFTGHMVCDYAIVGDSVKPNCPVGQSLGYFRHLMLAHEYHSR